MWVIDLCRDCRRVLPNPRYQRDDGRCAECGAYYDDDGETAT